MALADCTCASKARTSPRSANIGLSDFPDGGDLLNDKDLVLPAVVDTPFKCFVCEDAAEDNSCAILGVICGEVSITSSLAVAEVIVLVRMVSGDPFFCIPVPVTVHCILSFFSELAGDVEVLGEVMV